MGVNVANRSEVPPKIVQRARVVVDDLEQCRIEAGDLLRAQIDWNEVVPLAALVTKPKAGTTGRLTLFKSVGIALAGCGKSNFGIGG
jgi:1-piperideine-2-carboxylate/1-pyrroline-2-carboxylate reductase [NAD(P)H]